MNNLKSIGAALSITLFWTTSLAAPPLCTDLIKSHYPIAAAEVDKETMRSRGIEATRQSGKMSIELIDEIQGNHGGKLYVAQKIMPLWESTYSQFFDANVGSPLWFARFAGEKIGYFYGFQMINPEQVTIPNLEEIQGATAKLNAYLKKKNREPIALNFYLIERPTGYLQSEELEYLRNSGLNNALPIGSKRSKSARGLSPLEMHDINVHLGEILLPRSVLQHGFGINLRLAQFVDYLIELSKTDSKMAWLKNGWLIQRLVHHRAHDTDYLGLIVLNGVYHNLVKEKPRYVEAGDLSNFIFDGKSADQFILELFPSIDFYSESYVPNQEAFDRLVKASKDFVREFPGSRFTQPLLNKPLERRSKESAQFVEKVNEQMFQKVKDLEEAADFIMRNRSNPD